MLNFPIGILGQVWYLIVSIPDLYTLAYFVVINATKYHAREPLYSNSVVVIDEFTK